VHVYYVGSDNFVYNAVHILPGRTLIGSPDMYDATTEGLLAWTLGLPTPPPLETLADGPPGRQEAKKSKVLADLYSEAYRKYTRLYDALTTVLHSS
jgi:hypothetical protein